MKATITITDAEEAGTFRVDTDYEGGFCIESHAHQHAMLLVKHLGELADRRGATTAIGDSAESVDAIARAMDEPDIERRIVVPR